MTDNTSVRMSVELEIDAFDEDDDLLIGHKVLLQEGHGAERLIVELEGGEPGHGFGLSEVVTIAITIGSGVSSQLAADAVRSGVQRVIRRARVRSLHSDGSREGLAELIETERATQGVEEAKANSGQES